MIEFLNLPYTTIILAAIVPAFMHFFGVLMQVHLEAKRNGLRGMTRRSCQISVRPLSAIGRQSFHSWC